MNPALRISLVIAWLTVTFTVSPSHAENTPSTFSATISPLLASVIDQLPAQSVNEITPHIEALASIVKGNAMYDFFQNVAEECHKYQNKLGNQEQPTIPMENNEESQKQQENVSDSEKEPLKEENEVSKKEKEAPEKQEASNKEASDDQNDKTNAEGSSSDDESVPGATKVPNARKRLRLKDLPEGVTKRIRKNNIEVVLLKQDNIVSVSTRRPGGEAQPQKDIDITGTGGEMGVRKLVDELTKL